MDPPQRPPAHLPPINAAIDHPNLPGRAVLPPIGDKIFTLAEILAMINFLDVEQNRSYQRGETTNKYASIILREAQQKGHGSERN